MPLSFDELYRLYATDVLRVSYYYLGSREQAEDVTQDVFVRLIVNHPDLEPGREKAWLLKVALNRCRDLWRGAWFRKVVLGHPAFELSLPLMRSAPLRIAILWLKQSTVFGRNSRKWSSCFITRGSVLRKLQKCSALPREPYPQG